jgi:small subunit ribosomal protein S6
MTLYEEIMIIDPNLDENAINEIVENVKDKIIKQGGEILKSENWGSRKLAYQLNKQEKGHYIVLLFKAPPTTIQELERFAMITDAINKIMVIKVVKKKHVEAVMASLAAAAEKQIAEAQKPVIQQPEQTEEETVSPIEEETASPTEAETVSPIEEETASSIEEETVSPIEEETVSKTEEETASPEEKEIV